MADPGYYGQQAGQRGPPPDQGYDQYPPQPGNGYNDQYQGSESQQQHQGYRQPQPPQHHAYDSHDGRPIPPGFVPPHKPPPSADPGYDPNQFPPPPREEYQDYERGQGPSRDDYDDRGYDYGRGHEYDRGYDDDRGYDRHHPRSEYGHQGGGYSDRPYAPSEPHGHEGNQLAPYDEEKADAEWQRGYEEDQRRRQNVPPPPSDYELGRRGGRYDERDRRDDQYYDYRPDDRDRYDDRRYGDERDRHSNRRRDSRYGRYEEPRSPTGVKNKTGPDILGGKEGERGLGAQLLGGAAGGLVGHEMGGGVLETLGGIVVGAVGAKVLEHQHEKYKSKKESKLAAAPFKDQAIDGRAYSHSRPRSESRRDYDSRPPRRRESRRSDDSYSDDYSRSPPRRRETMN